jgi:hypothetical protein
MNLLKVNSSAPIKNTNEFIEQKNGEYLFESKACAVVSNIFIQGILDLYLRSQFTGLLINYLKEGTDMRFIF